VSELEKIWQIAYRGKLAYRRKWALCIAEGRERNQIAAILKAVRARVTFSPQDNPISTSTLDPNHFDLVIAAPSLASEREIAAVREKTLRPEHFLVVGTQSKPSAYCRRSSASPENALVQRNKSIQLKLSAGEPLRVVFLNDVGFRFGAGIALKRQVASLLLKGWDASLVSWQPGEILEPTFVTGVEHFDRWRGVTLADNGNGLDTSTTALAKIKTINPDLVITGNLHGAGWPLGLLRTLKSHGMFVVAYMHDTYLVTGRCAQPISCTLYRSGCNASCPTADEYPRLAPEQIAPAWHERGMLFTGPERIPLVGNSSWTSGIAIQRFGKAAIIETVHLGLDHEMFAPIRKSVARRLLGIPEDRPIVVMGAVDVHNQWKGGPLFHEFLNVLAARQDVYLVLFGRASEDLPCQKAFGLVLDERMMPFILNAGDIYVSTANAESFGQALLEASACALPVVAFDVGGVRDVIVNNETGVLVARQTLADLLVAVERLLQDRAEREAFGRNGRRRVENKFTLDHQADAWVDCLKRIC
jgi:glycosyltransferase involved in cell wall biosynthesis